MQNYQQVVGQIGGTSGGKMITPEEAVVLIDDLEATAPSIHQHYADEIALSVRSALTDAELFISYNMPAKALGPLVGILPLAPTDLRLNQRLAALHTRAGRFAEAALCCRTLQHLYSEAEHPDEATRYGELAERYEERSAAPAPGAPVEDAHIFLDAAPKVVQQHVSAPRSEVPEFSIDEDPAEASPTQEAPPAQAAASMAHAASPWPTAQPEFSVVDESSTTSAETAAASGEIDLSSEWDDSLTVETNAPAAEPAEVEVANAAGDHDVAESSKAEETVEEIRFYLAHGMPEQAMAALAKFQTLTGDQAKIAALRAEVEAAAQTAEEEASAAAEPVMEELTADDIPTIEVAVDEIPVVQPPAAVETHAVVAPELPVVEEAPVAAEVPVQAAPAAVVHAPAPEPEPQPSVLNEFVTDLETSLGDSFLPGTVAKPAAPSTPAPLPPKPVLAPAAHREPVIAAGTTAPVLGEFVADIEASLGEDFLQAAPVAKPEIPAPVAMAPPAPPVAAPVVAPQILPPMAASAAASASPTKHVAPPAPQVSAATVAPPATSSVAWHGPAVGVPKPQPPVLAAPHAPAAPAQKASPFAEDAGVDLAEMFGELKHDLESGVASNDEDPETHYNLGIAFREMGLLDEAIGELQKACQSFDHGHPFPQIMQTYTWLAQCFLEKGVPEAAVRWYDKALQVVGIDGETRVALHYELASAYEAAGDKVSALHHFMDVYGSNIDYRDVAERIKALKS
jgi:hypothetical protein